MIRSFRAQTTFWNAITIAVVLAAFCAAIAYANQLRMRLDIDKELRDRARRAPTEQKSSAQTSEAFSDVRRPRRFDAEGTRLGPVAGPPFDPAAVSRAIRGESGFSNGRYGGESIRIFTMPAREAGVVVGAIQTARETRDLDQIWSSQLITLLWFLPLAVVAAAAGAFFLTGRAIGPIAQMKSAASAITERDLSRRLEIRGSDEFAELGLTFNSMVARLEGAFEGLKKAYAELEEAHAAQRRFTADASHELKTPLTRLRLATSSALSEDTSDEDKRKALEVADQAAGAMGRLVQEMLILSRADAGQLRLEREKLDLRVVVSEALNAFSEESIRRDFEDSAMYVEGDRDHLSRVVANLVQNAVRHTPPTGRIDVSVRSDGSWAVLKVADTGEGVAAHHLAHLGERFYRVDEARRSDDGGNGLGLAICKATVSAMNGTIGFESEAGNGFAAEVRLPLKTK